jgi:hypothetical protein
MNSFENWRREVNIILNDIVGFSLKEMARYIEVNVKRLYEDGEDPIDAAQYAVGELDPTLDVEQMLADRLTGRTKEV